MRHAVTSMICFATGVKGEKINVKSGTEDERDVCTLGESLLFVLCRGLGTANYKETDNVVCGMSI